jgi:hypothetical protein
VTSEHPDSERITAAAAGLLAAGHPAGALLRDSGTLGTARAVSDRAGNLRFWFVPVLADDRIAGYFRIEADLSDWRWSSFQRRPDTLTGCPPAALWLDAEAIRKRALALAQPGEIAMGARLSYDRVPDRLAWIVPLQTPAGHEREVFVAGHAVWWASAEAAQESTDAGADSP